MTYVGRRLNLINSFRYLAELSRIFYRGLKSQRFRPDFRSPSHISPSFQITKARIYQETCKKHRWPV